jgi:hypothetical protein
MAIAAVTFESVPAYFRAYFRDKWQWNNGICADCNEPWIHADNDDHGGHEYKCRNNHTIWISYPVIRRSTKKWK